MAINHVLLAWIQFGIPASMHIIFLKLIIGLTIYLLVLEIPWLRTERESHWIQYRFWLKRKSGKGKPGQIIAEQNAYFANTLSNS